MTGVSISGSKEYFTGEYADSSTCTYMWYDCVYCQLVFNEILQDTKGISKGRKRGTQRRIYPE